MGERKFGWVERRRCWQEQRRAEKGRRKRKMLAWWAKFLPSSSCSTLLYCTKADRYLQDTAPDASGVYIMSCAKHPMLFALHDHIGGTCTYLAALPRFVTQRIE